jgi:pimeloyl-ACP methyl ester carboxylesterase
MAAPFRLVQDGDGDAAKTPVVWLPGWDACFQSEHVLGDDFMRGRRVVEVVFPHCPRDDEARAREPLLEYGGVSLESWLPAVDAALQSLDCQAVVLVGQSRGGLLALMYAAWGASRSKVAGVILDDPFLAWGDGTSFLETLALHVPLLCFPAWSLRGFDPLVAISSDTSPSLCRRELLAAGNPNRIQIPSAVYAGQIVDVGRLTTRLCGARLQVPVTAFAAQREATINDAQQARVLEESCGKHLRIVQIAEEMHLTLNSPALWPVLRTPFREMLCLADADDRRQRAPASSQDYNKSIDCSFQALLADVPQGLRKLLRRYGVGGGR